MFELSNLV